MTKATLKVFALLAVLSSVCAASLSAPAAPDATLEEMAGYRQWTRVAGEPGQIKFLPPGDVQVEGSAIAL
jgi:hypothetical protein